MLPGDLRRKYANQIVVAAAGGAAAGRDASHGTAWYVETRAAEVLPDAQQRNDYGFCRFSSLLAIPEDCRESRFDV